MMNRIFNKTVVVDTLKANLKRFNSQDVRNIPTYHPDALDKRILVHFKHYKSVEEVPHRVSETLMNQVENVDIVSF